MSHIIVADPRIESGAPTWGFLDQGSLADYDVCMLVAVETSSRAFGAGSNWTVLVFQPNPLSNRTKHAPFSAKSTSLRAGGDGLSYTMTMPISVVTNMPSPFRPWRCQTGDSVTVAR